MTHRYPKRSIEVDLPIARISTDARRDKSTRHVHISTLFIWYVDEHSDIGNFEVRQLLDTDDTLSASKQLKTWVGQGLLVVSNPDAGRSLRRYTRADLDPDLESFSNALRKRSPEFP